jgi:hypothetical protein
MAEVTIISDTARTVEAEALDGRLLLAPDQLEAGLGWELRAEGLCRGDVCVPLADPAALLVDGKLDVAATAAALGRPAVVDGEAGIAAVALDAEARRGALDLLQGPSFTLDDLEGVPHRLDEWRGVKKLLVAFSTW